MAVFPLGNLISDIVTNVKAWIINGTAAHDDPATGNPLQVGGVYRVADPTLSDGDAGSIRVNSKGEILIEQTGRNVQLLANTTVTWDGTKTSDYVSVPVGSETACLIMIDNNGQSQNLTVTFEFEVSSGVWMQWFDGGGVEVSFVANGNTRRVYGPFQGFPRYLQGRLKLTASTAPANTTTTVVQVQEVL